jgi:hypothetical protein
MRVRTALMAGALLLVVGVSGCGRAAGDGDGVATAGKSAAPNATASTDPESEQEQMLKHAQCMRENGVPEYPDPTFEEGGGVTLGLPGGVDPEKVEAAQEQCKRYLPNGGRPKPVDAETLEKMRQYAECMRANGVPKFPDPTADGGFQIEAGPDLDPMSPTFKAADEQCKHHMPGSPRTGTNTGRDG